MRARSVPKEFFMETLKKLRPGLRGKRGKPYCKLYLLRNSTRFSKVVVTFANTDVKDAADEWAGLADISNTLLTLPSGFFLPLVVKCEMERETKGKTVKNKKEAGLDDFENSLLLQVGNDAEIKEGHQVKINLRYYQANLV